MKCKHLWRHLDFHHSGSYTPCYRFKVDEGHNFGGVNHDLNLPSVAFNSAEWQNARQQMINDEWPAGCRTCKMQEEAGIQSYRLKSLEDDRVPDPDWTNTVSVCNELQLKLSKACNFLCRHCNVGSNSSFLEIGKKHTQIANELEEKHFFDHLKSNGAHEGISIPTREIIDDLFENVLPTTHIIEFAGGEPFYHAEMYRFLQRMIDDPKIDTSKIILQYNSNLSMLKFKDWDLVSLWENFKGIHLTVSMDGTGGVYNYFRQNGDYDQVIENIWTLLGSTNKIISLLLVCTTSAYHAFYLNEISRDLRELRDEILHKYEDIYTTVKATFVHFPKGLDVVNLAEETKKKILDELEIDEFTSEIAQRMRGNRTLPEETFKDIVRLQDEVYKRDASVLAPKIFDYCY